MCNCLFMVVLLFSIDVLSNSLLFLASALFALVGLLGLFCCPLGLALFALLCDPGFLGFVALLNLAASACGYAF